MGRWGTGKPPEKEGLYLVTYKIEIFKEMREVRQARRFKNFDGNWYWYILPEGTWATKEVVAWQKCPKPYEG